MLILLVVLTTNSEHFILMILGETIKKGLARDESAPYLQISNTCFKIFYQSRIFFLRR